MRNPLKRIANWIKREREVSESVLPAPAPTPAKPSHHKCSGKARRKIRGAFGHCKHPFDTRPALKPDAMRDLAKKCEERMAADRADMDKFRQLKDWVWSWHG